MGYHATEDVNRPCPCGSGRTYANCCLQRGPADRRFRRRTRWGGIEGEASTVGNGTEAWSILEKGLELLERGKAKDAIPQFEQAAALLPDEPRPHNNLALALMLAGDVNQALEIVEEVDQRIDPGNVFALGLLVQLYSLLDRQAEAERAGQSLLGKQPPDECAAVKKCEALARLGWHREVLAAALAGPAGDWGVSLAYFAGVAAINLARYDEAREYLATAAKDPYHGERAKRYHRRIERRQGPETVTGDWPYLDFHEWVPRGLVDRLKNDEDLKRYPGLVHGIAAMLNDIPKERPRAIDALVSAGTPRAREILRKVAFGTLGEDAIRVNAIVGLQKLGEIAPGEKIKAWVGGGWTEIQPRLIEVSSEHPSRMPPRGEEKLIASKEALRRGDLARAEALGRAVLAEAPGYPVVYQNLAVVLERRGRPDEAEDLLRTAIGLDPSYLFAPADLALMRLREGEVEAAREILAGVVLPEKVHPQAYAVYLLADARVAFAEENFERAAKTVAFIRTIAPDEALLAEVDTLWSKVAEGLAAMKNRLIRRRERMRRRLLDPDMTLCDCLKRYTKAELSRIACALHSDALCRLTKKEMVQEIRSRLLETNVLTRAVSYLPEAAREALRDLNDAGGAAPFAEFTRRHGCDSDDLERWGWRNKPRTTLGRLKVLGIVFEGTMGGQETLFMPPEVRPMLKRGLARCHDNSMEMPAEAPEAVPGDGRRGDHGDRRHGEFPHQ